MLLFKKTHPSNNQKLSLAVLTVTSIMGLLASTSPATANPFEFERKILAPDGASRDFFGDSIALDSGYALISSPHDDDNGLDSGSAYLFDVTSGDLVHKFLAPDGERQDYFSQSVALDSGYALIGSLNADSAYLFDVTSGDLVHKFLAPDGALRFGESVALDGDYALISSSLTIEKGFATGSAYLFDLTSGDLVQKFLAPDVTYRDRFGFGSFSRSIALDGGYALIGSYGDDDNGFDSGSAYLFDVASGDLVQKFLAPNGKSEDYFGQSVALDNGYALIGSYGDDDNGFNSGSAYLFDVTSGDLVQEFFAPDGAPSDFFGYSVVLDGDSALISSLWDSDNGPKGGSAYLFDITSGDLVQKFLAPEDTSFRQFGDSLALDGNSALISPAWDSDNGPGSGSTYLFTLKETPKPIPEASTLLGLLAIGTFGILKRL